VLWSFSPEQRVTGPPPPSCTEAEGDWPAPAPQAPTVGSAPPRPSLFGGCHTELGASSPRAGRDGSPARSVFEGPSAHSPARPAAGHTLQEVLLAALAGAGQVWGMGGRRARGGTCKGAACGWPRGRGCCCLPQFVRPVQKLAWVWGLLPLQP
jgi:hypothetical protein